MEVGNVFEVTINENGVDKKFDFKYLYTNKIIIVLQMITERAFMPKYFTFEPFAEALGDELVSFNGLLTKKFIIVPNGLLKNINFIFCLTRSEITQFRSSKEHSYVDGGKRYYNGVFEKPVNNGIINSSHYQNYFVIFK